MVLLKNLECKTPLSVVQHPGYQLLLFRHSICQSLNFRNELHVILLSIFTVCNLEIFTFVLGNTELHE